VRAILASCLSVIPLQILTLPEIVRCFVLIGKAFLVAPAVELKE